MSPAAGAAVRARPAASQSPTHSALDRWSDTGRATLRLVATRPLTVGRLPFALLVGGILGAGLVVLLLLHTLAAQDAFRLQDLQHQQARLADVEQRLALAQQHREAPASLAARARALGMVPTSSLAFVRPGRHGKVVGVTHAAVAPAPVAPAPTPSAATKPADKPADQPTTKPADQPSAGADKPAAGTATTPSGDSKPSHQGDSAGHHRRVSPKPGG